MSGCGISSEFVSGMAKATNRKFELQFRRLSALTGEVIEEDRFGVVVKNVVNTELR